MIKKLLSFSLGAIIVAGTTLLAQNLQLQDPSSNIMDGRTHYIYDNGMNMSTTEFHVVNSSANPINFDCTVWEIANATATEWQVCFGTACYIANDGVATGQTYSYATAPAMGSYNQLKVAPFSFGWVTGDFGVWKVSVFDNTNPTDSSACYIVWTANGNPAGDINVNTIIDGSEIAGDVNLNGIIDGNEITGDMNGNGIIDIWEVGGDANGNGIIDNGEILSINKLSSNNIDFSIFPNPVLDDLTINYSIKGGNTTNSTIDLYDVLGQKIETYNLKSNKGSLKINVGNLNAGIYFYAVKVNGEIIKTEKVIVR